MKKINIFQNILLGISLIILAYLPLLVAFGDMSMNAYNILYQISFISVFLVMIIRPLADVFVKWKILRKLVLLRKGFGVLSASIVVGFMVGDIITPYSTYILSMFTAKYWSLENYIVFAHIGNLTGLILLITSNKLSMIMMGRNWKRVQKLAYVYFYSGGIYEVYALNSDFAIIALSVVTILIILAFMVKIIRRNRENSRL